jgi:hypothetical protein
MKLPQNILQIILRPTIDQMQFGRFIVANSAVYWFVFLVWPGMTMDRPTYTGMRLIGDDYTWSAIFLLTAILQYLRLEIWIRTTKKALVIDTITAFVWTFTTTSMTLSVYPPPAAIAGEISIAFVAIWLWIHARLEREVLGELG